MLATKNDYSEPTPTKPDRKAQRSPLKLVETNTGEEYRTSYFKGIITPISWDKLDKATDYSLFMDNGDELVLRPLGEDLPLENLSNREVVVFGETLCGEILHYYEIRQLTKKNFADLVPVYNSYQIDEHNIMIPDSIKSSLIYH